MLARLHAAAHFPRLFGNFGWFCFIFIGHVGHDFREHRLANCKFRINLQKSIPRQTFAVSFIFLRRYNDGEADNQENRVEIHNFVFCDDFCVFFAE